MRYFSRLSVKLKLPLQVHSRFLCLVFVDSVLTQCVFTAWSSFPQARDSTVVTIGNLFFTGLHCNDKHVLSWVQELSNTDVCVWLLIKIALAHLWKYNRPELAGTHQIVYFPNHSFQTDGLPACYLHSHLWCLTRGTWYRKHVLYSACGLSQKCNVFAIACVFWQRQHMSEVIAGVQKHGIDGYNSIHDFSKPV